MKRQMINNSIINKIKYLLIGLLSGIILTTSLPTLANTVTQKIDVVLNGINVKLEGKNVNVESILYNSTTYLPMRKIVELVDRDIDWDGETMTANIISEKDVNDINDNKNNIILSDEKTSDDVYIYLINNKKYVNAEEFHSLYDRYQDNFKITFIRVDNEPIVDSQDPINMWINNEIVLENINFINMGKKHGRVYIELDYYENIILPLIKEYSN